VRKRGPPSEFEERRVSEIDPQLGLHEVQKRLNEMLVGLRYVEDLKFFARKFGLHYLKITRMGRRDLTAWIKENHPSVVAAKELGK